MKYARGSAEVPVEVLVVFVWEERTGAAVADGRESLRVELGSEEGLGLVRGGLHGCTTSND